MLKEVVQGIGIGLVAIVCVVSVGSYIGANIETHGGGHGKGHGGGHGKKAESHGSEEAGGDHAGGETQKGSKDSKKGETGGSH